MEAQTAKLRAYCVAMDLELVRIELDSGVSAKSLERPALQRALAALEAGEAEGLLVAKLDRLTRSVKDLGALVEDHFADRFSLVSVADSIDTRTAGGRLVLNVLASVSQWEREAVGERTRETLAHLRSQGVQLGAEAMGWRRTEDTDDAGRRVIEQVDDERATLARMAGLREQGHTYRFIADRLTAEGHRTKRGGRWHANTVRRVLARGVAA